MISKDQLLSMRQWALHSAQQAAVKRSMIGFLELSKSAHQNADGAIVQAQRVALPPACKEGCCHCCHGLIPATLPEILDLARVVEGWDNAAKARLAARLADYEAKSKSYWRYDSQTFQEACPFLENDRCQVYAHRPLFCRGKSSYDPADCAAQREGKNVPIHAVPGQHEVGAALVNGIFAGIKAAGRFSGTYDLGASVGILFEHPNAGKALVSAVSNPLNRVMMGSDANVQVRPLNEAARRFLTRDLAECFAPNQTPEQEFQTALRVSKGNPYGVLCQMLLPTSYDSQEELEEWWARYHTALDSLPDLNLDPEVVFESPEMGAANTFGLAYTGKDVRPTLEKLGRYFHGMAIKAHPSLTIPIEDARRPGKFRLGFLSRRLRNNNGSRWALGWLTELSSDFETFAFNLNESDDHVSTRWRRNADHYFHLPMPAAEAGKIIRAQDLDALIFTDVGSDGVSFQLTLLRLARKQMACWGFPMTTGSPEMDYFISAEDMEPENAQEHYVETLFRLPGSGQSFPMARLSSPSGKSPSDLGLPSNGFSLIAQNPAKLLPSKDWIYREIAERTGQPVVICDSADGKIGAKVEARMRAAGVDVRRLPFMADSDFFRTIQLADRVLDSFDFTGGITTIDALTLKNPPVTCLGQTLRGRLGVPFIRQSGVDDMIVRDEHEFIELACDQPKIEYAKQRCEPGGIYRDPRPVRVLEAFLLSLFGRT